MATNKHDSPGTQQMFYVLFGWLYMHGIEYFSCDCGVQYSGVGNIMMQLPQY